MRGYAHLTGKIWDRLVVGSLTICKIYMEFGGCQDDVAPKAGLFALRRRAFANLTEQCTRAVKLFVDNVQADDSSLCVGGIKRSLRGCTATCPPWWRSVLAVLTHTTMRRGFSTRPWCHRILTERKVKGLLRGGVEKRRE